MCLLIPYILLIIFQLVLSSISLDKQNEKFNDNWTKIYKNIENTHQWIFFQAMNFNQIKLQIPIELKKQSPVFFHISFKYSLSLDDKSVPLCMSSNVMSSKKCLSVNKDQWNYMKTVQTQKKNLKGFNLKLFFKFENLNFNEANEKFLNSSKNNFCSFLTIYNLKLHIFDQIKKKKSVILISANSSLKPKLNIDGYNVKDINDYFKVILMPKVNQKNQIINYSVHKDAKMLVKLRSEYQNLELCVNFHFLISDERVLDIKLTEPNAKKAMLIASLRATLSDQKQPNDTIYNWYPMKFCLHWFVSNIQSKKNYLVELKVSGKTNIGLVALSDPHILTLPLIENPLADFMHSWKVAPLLAQKEWNIIPNVPKRFDWEMGKYNDLYLKFIPSPVKKSSGFHLFSRMFLANANEQLTLRLNSTLNDGSMVLTLMDKSFSVYQVQTVFLNQIHEAKLISFALSKQIVDILNGGIAIFKISFTSSNKSIILGDEQAAVYDLQLSDACAEPQACNYRGKCISISANVYQCKCDINFHGDRCEYLNRCVYDDRQEINGEQYCKTNHALRCIPMDNEYECECPAGRQWLVHERTCIRLSLCAFVFCEPNEYCEEVQFMENKEDHSIKKLFHDSSPTAKNEWKQTAYCKCKPQYLRNERTGYCELNMCESSTNPCPVGEKCTFVRHLNGGGKKICHCPLGFSRLQNKCEPDSLSIHNVFIVQELQCKHRYEYDGFQVHCACFEGYYLTENNKDCVLNSDFDFGLCPNCNERQICVFKQRKTTKNETYISPECKCRVGFIGESCKQDICTLSSQTFLDEISKKEINSIIAHYCDGYGCGLAGNRFRCLCSSNTILNSVTGRCELRPVCTRSEKTACVQQNAVCIAQLVKGKLIAKCECLRGYTYSNKMKSCVWLCNLITCDQQTSDSCEVDLFSNRARCLCKQGHVYDENTQQCVLAQETMLISLKVKLNQAWSGIQNDNEKNSLLIKKNSISIYGQGLVGEYLDLGEENNQVYNILGYNATKFSSGSSDRSVDCSKMSTVNACAKYMNSLIQEIYIIHLQDKASGRVKFNLRRSLQAAMDRLLGKQTLAKVTLLKYNYLSNSKLVYEWGGQASIFAVDFTLDIVRPNSITSQLIEQLFTRSCVKLNKVIDNWPMSKVFPNQDMIDFNSEKERIMSKYYERYEYNKDVCVLFPGLMFLNSKISVQLMNLCELNGVLKCSTDSSCVKRLSAKTVYECECKHGFEAVHTQEMAGLLKSYCRDVDECANPQVHKCNEHSICVNEVGSYRCLCKPNFKRVNSTACTAACTKDFDCVNGYCEVFQGNHERCICNPGFKGIDCSKEIGKAIEYKTTIATSIIVVCTMSFATFVVTYMFVSKYELENILKETVNDEMQSMSEKQEEPNDAYELQILEASEHDLHQNTTHSA